jgi:hypothetical protein
MKFKARLGDGKFDFGSTDARNKFNDFSKKNKGELVTIELYLPESKDQRGFFEGAVVPLITFYQEGKDHRNTDDCVEVREWLKIEFNANTAVVNGKAHKVAGSTKGKLNRGFLEDVINWMDDQGYKIKFLNPDMYKDWRDRIFPNSKQGDPDNFIDYLVSIGKL